MRSSTVACGAPALLAGLGLAACGLALKSADLFVLTRTGPRGQLTLLVNDGGTVRCDRGRVRQLPDPLLLQARDLAVSLDKDVQERVRLTPSSGASVYSYSVKLTDGTLNFADVAAARHSEVAQAEQFVLRVAQGPCAGAAGS